MRSGRLDKLPPYLFIEIDRLKNSLVKNGVDVLDLGIGDPDIGPPEILVNHLITAIESGKHNRYPPDRGHTLLISAIIAWAKREYRVELSEDEVLVTIGSKEAIGHLPLAVVDQGDLVLVPDPGYPVYRSSSILAGADLINLPLKDGNGFWPELDLVEKTALSRAKILVLNYPNNPTSAVALKERFEEAVEIAGKFNILLVNDAAYSEVIFEGAYIPLFPIAREKGIDYVEFYSFSKSFSITGWRVGYAIGSPSVIGSLAKVKSNLDSGVFGAIQEAVAEVMNRNYEKVIEDMREIYRIRRDILADYLQKAGLVFQLPPATFYFWVKVPDARDSISFCRYLLEKKGIVATPGVGFGKHGEGYFRLSITSSEDILEKAGRAIVELSERGWK